MKLSLARVLGGVAAAAVAGGVLLGTAGAASAATAPTFEPDPASKGSISLYDATGHVITSGNVTDSPLASYYVASGGALGAGETQATVAYATPQDGIPTLSWSSVETWTAPSTFSPAPTYPGDLAGSTAAIAKGASTDGGLDVHIAAFPNQSTANPNIYQIRLFTSSDTTRYYSTDILVNGSTWTQVYPAQKTATTTTLVASPSPAYQGDAVTLTATETPAAAGSVQFKDGATNLGAPVPVDATGKAVTQTSALAVGAHSLSAVFTPTDATTFNGSTGTASLTVNAPATATSTTLAVTPNAFVGDPASLSATVAPSGVAGSVAFTDGGAPIAGTVTKSGDTYSLALATGFPAGSHSVVATFTPSNAAAFKASSSPAQSFIVQAKLQGACAQTGSACSTDSNVQATIPVGTLVISTPYTTTNKLDLGTLKLNADNSAFTGTATFDNIQVVDTRSGGLGYTVTGLATNLTDGGSNANSVINAQNLGLTGLSVKASTGGFTGVVTPTNNPAAAGVGPNATGSLGLGGSTAHTVFSVDKGLGTVNVKGTLTLNAPTTTEAGTFLGTITFTVG